MCYALPPEILRDVPNPPAAPVVYIDGTDLARIMAMVMVEQKRYRKPRDIIEHVKKCGAYDCHETQEPRQIDKWVKIVEKAFNTLQLSDEEKVGNVYGLMFEKADDWLTKIINLYEEAFTW